MKKRILVIAVHPDDETLGAGGSLLRHKKDKDDVFWLIITRMNPNFNTSEKIEIRNEELKEVSQAYGFDHVHSLDIDSQNVEEYSLGHLVKLISDVVKSVEPEIMYLPFYGDAHSEHKIIFEAAFSCTKSFRFPTVKEVYLMEVLSETNFSAPIASRTFTPNYFVDITPYIDKKVAILNLYKSEIQAHPFPRSVESLVALACLRGSQIGVDYAEAFMCLKNVR